MQPPKRKQKEKLRKVRDEIELEICLYKFLYPYRENCNKKGPIELSCNVTLKIYVP